MNCLCVLLVLLSCAGCRRDMFRQPKSNPLNENTFFADGGASRPLPPHTIARGHLDLDEAFQTGLIGTNPVVEFPFPVTRETLAQGRVMFEANCAPCHGRLGDGNGMVVHRGFPAPPSLHIDRIRDAPAGHFVDVMTRGYGIMASAAPRVERADRWAIAAYIRALQLSQHAAATDIPKDEQAKLGRNSP
jgi:mono/diheme cytochrome c family protein